MKGAFFYQANPFTKILLTLFIAFASFIVFFIFSTILAMPLFGLGPADLLHAFEDLTNPENLSLLKYFQIAQSTGLFLIPPFILGYYFSGNSISYLKLNKSPVLLPSLITILIILTCLPVINLLSEINQGLHFPYWLSSLEEWMKRTEESAQKLTESFLNVSTVWGLILNLLMIAVIPAIGEELIFRGVIQKIFIEWVKNIHIGILISAVFFSAMHFQFYGFLPRMMLGILFGYLFVFSGSIWYPIIAHFFNNALAVLVYYFVGKETVENSIDQFGAQGSSVYFAFLGLIVLVFLMRIFKSKLESA